MTLPLERCRSVMRAGDFLRDLLDPGKTPKVPGVIRDRAAALLRHYPWAEHLRQASERSPDVFHFPETRKSEDRDDGTAGYRGESRPRKE